MMNRTMQAATVRAYGAPLVVGEWPKPKAGPGQILVRTEACGVCQTDLQAARGDGPLKPMLPFIPGHEGVGRVVALGAGARGVKEGDRVGVPWLFADWESESDRAAFGSYARNGGFADFIVADPAYVAHIPTGLKAQAAAPLICAGVTSYKGLKETRTRPGEWVVISGVGGLGHLAVQYAKAMGMLVCAVDMDEDKLSHATRLGANAVVNASMGDAALEVLKLTSGGGHGVLVTAPSAGAFHQGVAMTRKRGTCVLVGLPPQDFPAPPVDVAAKSITILGSFVGSRRDMNEALAFAAHGLVLADVELQPLTAINTVFDRLTIGQGSSRVVLDFA